MPSQVDVHAGTRMMMKRLRGAVGIGSRRADAAGKSGARDELAAQGRKR